MMSSSTAPNITGAAQSGRPGKLASCLRPRSYWEVLVYHLPLALITGIPLLLPHLVALNRLPLIPCTFLHLTGYPCPLCGTTRAFWAIANGQWGHALTNSPFAFVVFFLVAVIFLWNAVALVSNRVILPGPLLRQGSKYLSRAALAILLLLAANWAYRLLMGFDQ